MPIDPEQFKNRFPMCKGESSKCKGKGKAGKHMSDKMAISSSASRFASTSISDNNIANCNKRFLSNNGESEEVRLWLLAKDIGVVCVEDEENVIKRLVEMEERDQ